MSLMSVDLVNEQTGEAFIGFVDRSDPPDFGVTFKYEHEGELIPVKRVPSVIPKPQVKSYQTRALSRPRWHPAFEHHDKRGYGLVDSRAGIERVLDKQNAKAKSEDDLWTWDKE